ncbi:MAG: divergent PAP2 family protein [Firmicutes bacterium]|nr:divergent PAP2 family protein [Bacillota bacterium]
MAVWAKQLLHNDLLICAVLALIIAQIFKLLIYSISNKKLDLQWLLGSGGMPSSHSAAFSALVMASGLRYGFDSYQFALAALPAAVVIYDACGVRRATGEHAKLLNELQEIFKDDNLPEKKLKILIGHTPLQALAGITLGIITAWLFRF